MLVCYSGASSQAYSLEQDIAAAATAGFPALEIWGPKLGPYLERHSVQDLAAQLHARHLRPAAIDFIAIDLSREEPLAGAMADLRRYGEVATAIDCHLLLLIVVGRRPELSKEQALNYLAKLMLPLCDAAGRYGLRLALEPLGRDPLIPGPREAMEIIRISRRDNLGIALDLFHFYKSGLRLDEARLIPPERLYIVHVADAPPRDPAVLKDTDRLWPGERVIPLDDYLEVLRDLRFDGPISVEVPNKTYALMDPDTLAREAFESLEEFLTLRV